MQKANLLGKRFGRLTVTQPAEPIGKKTSWICRCDCGVEKRVMAGCLVDGTTNSCGCMRSELLKQRSYESHLGNQKHGLYKTSEYFAWANIKNRCLNPRHNRYPDWGGRGIEICARWKDSFENFLIDMGKRPGRGYSIERIDNNGHYEPSNCKWATITEQNSNKRKRRWWKRPILESSELK